MLDDLFRLQDFCMNDLELLKKSLFRKYPIVSLRLKSVAEPKAAAVLLTFLLENKTRVASFEYVLFTVLVNSMNL